MDTNTIIKRPTHVGLTCKRPSLCRAEFKEQVSVNNMIARLLGGDSSVLRRGIYFDATGFDGDYHTLQNKLASARTVWADLPEKVRAAYGSPENMLAEVEKLSQKSNEVKTSNTEVKPPVTSSQTTEATTAEATL